MKFADLELRFLSNFEKLNTTIDAINKRLDQAEKHTKQTGKQAEDSANRISAAIAKIGKAAALATAAISGVVVAAVAVKNTILSFDEAAERIDNLGKVAKQLQVPIEQLSVLRFAAGESGVEFETLSKMAAKASKNLAEMLSEGKTVLPIGRMNIKLTDSLGRLRSITELLPEIATGIEGLGSAGQKIDVASKIFGKEGGAEFVKFLADGGNFIQNMAEQAERAKRLGVIFNDDQVKKLTAYKDAVGRVEEAFLGLKVSVMTEVAPALTSFANELALQIGSVAPTLSGASRALSLSAKGTPAEQDQAIKDLQVLKTSFVELATTALVEGGRVGGEAFVESLKVGVIALWPVVFDQIRNNLAHIFKGSAFDSVFTATPSKRLAELQASRTGAQTEIDELRKRIDDFNSKPATAYGAGYGYVAMGIANMQKRLDTLLNLDREIKLVTAEMDEDFASRTIAIAQASAEAVDKTSAAYERAKERIGAAVNTFNEAKAEILSRYGPEQASGTAAGPTGSFPILEVFDSLGDGWDALTARLERVEPKLGQVTDKLMARVAAIQDFRSDLGRRSQMATAGMSGADTDRIRMLANFEDQVQALVQKLGPDSQLISELRAVQDLELEAFDADRVARMAKETEQWVKALRRTVDPASDVNEEMGLITARFADGTIDFELYSKAMDLYASKLNKVTDLGERFGETMTDAIRGFSDDATRAFADFALEGKGSFEEVAKAFERMLFETATKALIWKPVFDALGVWFGGMFGGSQTNPTGWQGPPQSDGSWAKGGIFDRGSPVAFASGGIVSGPTMFPMSGGRRGLMGEAGPEAIMPLQRIGGDLGVRATGGGVTVQIIDQRGSGERPQVTESTGSDGRRMINILIRDQVRTAFSEGSMDTLMGRMYGLRRAGT